MKALKRSLRLSHLGAAPKKRPLPKTDEYRSPFQKDVDRILYCTAFRRLDEITQVVPSDHIALYHNRLTHSMKVAQIGMRIAQRVSAINTKNSLNKLGGLDPDVVYAAGLAHDLGHPPFGHVTEQSLDEVLIEDGIPDGYEGNAQSFRIVTKLALRGKENNLFALDLTVATLNAMIKYPWTRSCSPSKHYRKYGYYRSEENKFNEVRKCFNLPVGNKQRSLEAEIMDWADDISYAVYDLEDFIKAGLIPFDKLVSESYSKKPGDEPETKFLFDATVTRWQEQGRPPDSIENLKNSFNNFYKLLRNLRITFPQVQTLRNRYSGEDKQRVALRAFTSYLVNQYILALDINKKATATSAEGMVIINQECCSEVTILKELVWTYVIERADLCGSQHGHRNIVRFLYKTLSEAIETRNWALFPVRLRNQLINQKSQVAEEKERRARVVADLISGFTETEIASIYYRLTGHHIAL